MFIQDSVSRIMRRSPFGWSAWRWTNRGWSSLERKRTQHAEIDLHVRSYGERHVRLYADTLCRGALTRECLVAKG
jgi:hypothetical protein